MSISFSGCAGETWLYEGSGEGDHRYLEESGKTASYKTMKVNVPISSAL